ncbi:MAG: phosphosulfolactate synthase, partial [Pseudomonadota bacterium]
STLRPTRASATTYSLNSVGYGVLVLGMKNTLLLQGKSVHQTGGTPTPAEGTHDPQILIDTANECLNAGADIIIFESGGITENADPWRTDVAAKIKKQVGMNNVMFEAADPEVFKWYIKNYGIDVNMFIDHSQIVQLECLRRGIWGAKSTFGRITTHR